MIPFSAFYDHLMPQLPGITTQFLDIGIREVARDFCHKTHAWTAEFDPVNTQSGVSIYDLEPSEAQAETIKVIRLTVNDVLLYDERYPRFKTVDNTEDYPVAPQFIEPPFTISVDMTEITLNQAATPSAAQAQGLKIYGSMQPSHSATQLPDFFRNTYRQTLANGVLSHFMMMSRKPWTDAATGSMKQSSYQSDTLFAATKAQRGNTRSPIRVRSWG